MARGLMPTATASAHWLAHPQFAQAVEDFLAREGIGMESYLAELRERTPFKNPEQACPNSQPLGDESGEDAKHSP